MTRIQRAIVRAPHIAAALSARRAAQMERRRAVREAQLVQVAAALGMLGLLILWGIR